MNEEQQNDIEQLCQIAERLLQGQSEFNIQISLEDGKAVKVMFQRVPYLDGVSAFNLRSLDQWQHSTGEVDG